MIRLTLYLSSLLLSHSKVIIFSFNLYSYFRSYKFNNKLIIISKYIVIEAINEIGKLYSIFKDNIKVYIVIEFI